MPINPEVIRFLPVLEAAYSMYSESMPAREILLCALNWPTDYWPALALGWLEQGAPIDFEIAVRLESIGQGRQYGNTTNALVIGAAPCTSSGQKRKERDPRKNIL